MTVATLSALDVFIPSMGAGARQGASFDIDTGVAGALCMAGPM